MIRLLPTSLTHLKSLHLTLCIPTSLSSLLTFLPSRLLMLWSLQELCLLSGKLFSQIVTHMTVFYDLSLCSWLTFSKKLPLVNKPQVATLCAVFLPSQQVFLSYLFLPICYLSSTQKNLHSLRSGILPEFLIVVSRFARQSNYAQ